MVRVSSLMVIAGVGGVAVGCMGLLLTKEKERLKTGPAIVKKALEIAKEQEAIRELLGDNIEAQAAKLERDRHSLFDSNHAKVLVPIRGDNDNGHMFVYARRKDKDDRLRLWKIEMSFDKIEGKKMVLLDLPGDETISDEADVEFARVKEEEEAKRKSLEKPKSIYADFDGPMPKGLELKKELERRKAAGQVNPFESQPAPYKTLQR